MGMRFLYGGDKNILKLGMVMDAQFCKILKATGLYTLKWVNCIICELDLNKTDKNKAQRSNSGS
jgi:hypothetical protein